MAALSDGGGDDRRVLLSDVFTLLLIPVIYTELERFAVTTRVTPARGGGASGGR